MSGQADPAKFLAGLEQRLGMPYLWGGRGELATTAADGRSVTAPHHKHLPGWRTIGAAGGGSKTTTLEAAQAQGARVRFAGFRRLPLARS